MDTNVVFRGGREEARRVVRSFIGQLTGREPDQGGLARSVFYTLGFAALSDIQADYITKARGGTGEDGNTWQKLSPEYLAYSRRFGRGEQKELKAAAGLGRENRFGVGGKGGVLTKAQQARWYALYNGYTAALAARHDIGHARSMAAAMAWNKIKDEGAKTKLEVYGNRTVEILRDTGVLFNSIGPGYLDNNATEYSKPTSEGGDQQIFTAMTDGIIIGTNVPYARSHNQGDPKRGIPARPFIPEKVPDTWLARWAAAGMSAVSNALGQAMARGAT